MPVALFLSAQSWISAPDPISQSPSVACSSWAALLLAGQLTRCPLWSFKLFPSSPQAGHPTFTIVVLQRYQPEQWCRKRTTLIVSSSDQDVWQLICEHLPSNVKPRLRRHSNAGHAIWPPRSLGSQNRRRWPFITVKAGLPLCRALQYT